MKILAAVLATLMLASGASAKPPIKKIAKFLVNHVTLDIAAGGSAGFATAAGVDCRHRLGVEPCTGGYGEFKGIEAARWILTGSLIVFGEYERKHEESLWFVPALGVTALNVTQGVQQLHQHKKDKTP